MNMSNKIPKSKQSDEISKNKRSDSELDKIAMELAERLEFECDQIEIGQILREEIQNSNYTQEEIAKILHMDRKTINGYCNGTEYTYSTLLKFSHLFGCSVDYLLGLTSCRNAEYESIHEATGLSNASIDRLVLLNKAAKHEITWLFDYLIQNDDFIMALKNYIYLDGIPDDKLYSTPLTDARTQEPIYILQFDHTIMDAPDLKRFYAYGVILSIFDRLDDYLEERPLSFSNKAILK